MNYKQIFNKMFPEFPRVRSNDPLTSFQAADSIKDSVSQHHQEILHCLIRHGALGKDGIAARTNLDGNQVARRMNEMRVLGLVMLTGNTVKSNTGRNEREWQAAIPLT
jgi:predicted transcriptional regulator